jgi:hypothetical protein
MGYQLNILIDNTGLEEIYSSGSSVVIVRNWIPNPEFPVTIAWQAFHPFESNQVSWTDDYQVYVTQSQPLVGSQISMIARAAAQPGCSCTFANDQLSVSPGGSDPQGFEFFNDQPPALHGFGLAQAATINGVESVVPFSLIELFDEQSGTITPYEEVFLYLAPGVSSGQIVQSPPANALVVGLRPESPTVQIGYNDATGAFYLQN